MDHHDQRRRSRRRPGGRCPAGSVQTAVHRAAVVAGPLDQLGLEEIGASKPPTGPRADVRAFPRRVVHDDLGRRAARRCGSPPRRRPRQVSDPCTPLPTSCDGAGGHVDDAEAAEASLVAVEGDAVAVGRPGERPLAETPARDRRARRARRGAASRSKSGSTPRGSETRRHRSGSPRAARPERNGPAGLGHRGAEYALRMSPLPSARRAAISLMSHDMSGTDHCCQATHSESVVKAGSKQKSTSAESRTGHEPSSASGTRPLRNGCRSRTRPSTHQARLQATHRPCGLRRDHASRDAAVDRSQPQPAIGSRVHQPGSVGQPVERAAAVRTRGHGRRIRRHDELCSAGRGNDDKLAATGHGRDERDQRAVGDKRGSARVRP